jgi:hypothetical protein
MALIFINSINSDLALVSLLSATLLIFWFLRLSEKRRLQRIYEALEIELSDEVFSETMVADLPPLAQRYFRHAIQPGTPLASSLQLKFTGNTQFGAKSPKLWSIEGSDIRITPQRGFVWKETMKTGPVIHNGTLYYANNKGEVLWRFFDFIPDPAKSGGGADTAKGMLGRFITQYIWTPFALLPQRGAVWEEIDEEHAKVTVSVDGTPVTLTLMIDPDGRLRESVSLRWGAKTKDGSFAYFSYGITVDAEETFDGYTIPSRLSATWCYEDSNREAPLIFHYQVEQACFT